MSDTRSAGTFKGVAPMFLTDDVRKTAEWYRETLGFAEGDYYLSDHGPDEDEADPHNEHHPAEGGAVFVIIERDGQRLMFGRTMAPGLGVHSAFDAKAFACNAYFWLDGIRAYYEAVKATDAEMLEEYVVQPYGLAEFRVRDIDGRVVTFGGPPEA